MFFVSDFFDTFSFTHKREMLSRCFFTFAKIFNYDEVEKRPNSLIWYHALSLDFLLDTTLTITPYEVCNQFYQNEMTSLIGNDHYEASARFCVNCWLWNLRHGRHETAKVWKEKLVNCLEIYSHSSITSTFTTVRVVEALTLQLAFVIEERNMDLTKTVESELKTVKKL
jgi:hypothetical protein